MEVMVIGDDKMLGRLRIPMWNEGFGCQCEMYFFLGRNLLQKVLASFEAGLLSAFGYKVAFPVLIRYLK